MAGGADQERRRKAEAEAHAAELRKKDRVQLLVRRINAERCINQLVDTFVEKVFERICERVFLEGHKGPISKEQAERAAKAARDIEEEFRRALLQELTLQASEFADAVVADKRYLVERRRQLAHAAASARHDKPGGSREKRRRIREIWASGKYKSRDVCAEQECAALGMSLSAARKALKGIPNP